MTASETHRLFRRGIELFNEEEFFECHEVLEELWTFSQQPDRWFLQALIHFAVGFYHHGRGNRNGATRQLHKGLIKLSSYLPSWDGINTGEIAEAVRERLSRIESDLEIPNYPKVSQYAPWPGLRSPLRT